MKSITYSVFYIQKNKLKRTYSNVLIFEVTTKLQAVRVGASTWLLGWLAQVLFAHSTPLISSLYITIVKSTSRLYESPTLIQESASLVHTPIFKPLQQQHRDFMCKSVMRKYMLCTES